MTEKKNPVIREKCGTPAGWNAHNYYGETQCAPCLRAKADYMQDWRLRTGRTKYKLVHINQGEAA